MTGADEPVDPGRDRPQRRPLPERDPRARTPQHPAGAGGADRPAAPLRPPAVPGDGARSAARVRQAPLRARGGRARRRATAAAAPLRPGGDPGGLPVHLPRLLRRRPLARLGRLPAVLRTSGRAGADRHRRPGAARRRVRRRARAARRRRATTPRSWWSARARPARSSPTGWPRPGAGCWCSSAGRTWTRATSSRTRSRCTSSSTTRAHCRSHATSASRCCRACASVARRWSTTRSASTRRRTCSDAWERDTGLDRAGVERATAEVREWLRIAPADPHVANPAGALFARGAAAAGLGGDGQPARRQHRGLLRLRLLQHRLRLRPQALDARHRAARGPGALRRPPAGARRTAWRPGSSTTARAAPWPSTPRPAAAASRCASGRTRWSWRPGRSARAGCCCAAGSAGRRSAGSCTST